MKLYQLWNVKNAWNVMTSLKKSPQLAYRLLKYGKLIRDELAICEEKRLAFVYEVSGAAPGETVDIPAGTPEFTVFLGKFNEFLQQDSDLPWAGMTLDELIGALGSEVGNCITENELELLEPFFTKPETIQ